MNEYCMYMFYVSNVFVFPIPCHFNLFVTCVLIFCFCLVLFSNPENPDAFKIKIKSILKSSYRYSKCTLLTFTAALMCLFFFRILKLFWTAI